MDHNDQIEELSRRLAAQEKENDALRRRLDARRFSWRNLWAYLFLAVGLAAILPADILLWANRTITNNQQYVNTVGPVINEPTVQKAITKYATDTIYSQVNIQQTVANLLPPQAQPLAGPVSSQVTGYINSSVAKIVASPRFAQAWVNFNRQAQSRFMKIASNPNATPNITVSSLYQSVSQNLSGSSLAFLGGHTLPPKVGDITIVTIPALAKIPYYVSTLSDLRWLMLGLAIGFMILALAVAENRRRMAIMIGTGWMAFVVLGVISVRITRTILIGQIADPTYAAAASSIWQALLKPLYGQTVILFLLGLVLVIVGWLLGPSRVAVKWKGAGQGVLSGWQAALVPNAGEMGWVRWLRRNHIGLLWLIAILTFVVLAILAPLTVMTLCLVVLGAIIVWLVLEFFVVARHETARD